MATRIVLVLTLLTLMALLITPAFAQTPTPLTETPLLSIATKVATLDNVIETGYFWISDHQALFFRHIPKPHQVTAAEKAQMEQASPGFQYPKDFAPGYYIALVIDTDTGKAALLQPFDTKYANAIPANPMIVTTENEPDSAYTAYNSPTCDVSPDGKWMVWLKGGQLPKQLIASTLDTSREVKWPAANVEKEDYLACLPDSRHWIDLHMVVVGDDWRYKDATIYDISSAGASRKVVVDELADDLPKGFTSDGSLLSLVIDFQHLDAPLKIRIYDLAGDTAKTQDFTVSSPEGARFLDLALSPAGDRLAWIFNDPASSSIPGANEKYTLWLSDTHGGGMHEIGSMRGYSTSKEINHHSYYFPETLRWTPDGKHISFIFRDALYTVPAP